MRPSVDERFFAKIEQLPEAPGCWLWTGGLSEYGYSDFYAGGHVVRGHRWSYERFHGPIPAGLVIDHMCAVRSCVNPAHLRAVTDAENVKAPWSMSPSRLLAERKACAKRGHPYTPENTLRKADGNRWCRACARIGNRDRKRRARLRRRLAA